MEYAIISQGTDSQTVSVSDWSQISATFTEQSSGTSPCDLLRP